MFQNVPVSESVKKSIRMLSLLYLATFLTLSIHPLKKLLAVCKDAKPAAEFCKLFPYLRVSVYRLDWFAVQDKTEPPKKLAASLLISTRRHQVLQINLFNQLWQDIVRYLQDSAAFAEALHIFTGHSVVDVATHNAISRISPLNQLVKATVRKLWIDRGNVGDPPSFNLTLPPFDRLRTRLQKNLMYRENHSEKWGSALLEFLEFKTKTVAERRSALSANLTKNGCSLRSDSLFCKQFLAGLVCCEMDEVVAIVKLTQRLFAYGHAVWSILRLAMESQLEGLVVDTGKSWIPAVTEFIASPGFHTTCTDAMNAVASASIRRKRDRYDDYDGYADGYKKRRFFKRRFW
ncbi:hypothetical protein BCR33DRAFT_307061 [Rhizoclosmatium globosum]|uniref:Uncharacterized protein n=1 Tax=Rhizoclosmatium globosum TaxID=329046 RepID=A0A1Y2C5H5_9FUNG|nr:hypothetical protein BCR33DRAFT_307061 [Rhizoclosmatium globosum]|eukprot:ORY42283.1 hypothetical protein BCR33DRAFT_307061 [Rhizoclosmatium globosum]